MASPLCLHPHHPHLAGKAPSALCSVPSSACTPEETAVRVPEPRERQPFATIMQKPWVLTAATLLEPALPESAPTAWSCFHLTAALGTRGTLPIPPASEAAVRSRVGGAFMQSHQACQTPSRLSQPTCLAQDIYTALHRSPPQSYSLGAERSNSHLRKRVSLCRREGGAVWVLPGVGASPPGVGAARRKGVEPGPAW